jgi:site-specific DNA-cytosine methylase
MTTIATLCTGGGGVEVGAMAVGLTPLWGIEYDDEIANVARTNGLHVITADVCEADPADYERPDVLHASPPCPHFSNANQGGEETDEDVAIAEAVARFVEALRPAVFTLENVYMYRKSQSWALIADTLNRCGYWFDLAHVNAADFGVPQTRKRMIVRALLGRMVPHLPPAEPWVGWYEAIEDLIPTLPESEFAPWQLERLPDEFKSFIVNPNRNSFSDGWKGDTDIASTDRPMFAIAAQKGLAHFRAFIVGSNSVDGSTPPTRTADKPALTVDTKTPGHLRAFLVGDQAKNAGEGVQLLEVGRPAMTVTTRRNGGTEPRAFLVESKNANQEYGDGLRDGDSPAFTVVTDHKPSHAPKGWLSQGRVVQMTPRALARFQSFPDWYELPESRTLACRIIGNAVPPLLYEKLIRQLVVS